MKQLFMWLLQQIMKITGKWISRSIFWKKHVRPQAIYCELSSHSLHACACTCNGIHEISEHGVSEFGHMACQNSIFFFFFFFFCVSPMSFLKLRETHATRVFYTGEIIAAPTWAGFPYWINTVFIQNSVIFIFQYQHQGRVGVHHVILEV